MFIDSLVKNYDIRRLTTQAFIVAFL